MNKFIAACNNMSKEAALLISYGTKLALGVLIIGICAYKYNEHFIGGYANGILCIKLIQAAFSLFVQFIIGGIMLDCAQKDK